MQAATRQRVWRNLFQLTLTLLSLYYLYRAVNYRFLNAGQMGPPNPIASGC